MSEMVESTITSHTYVAHVPVPSQKEVTYSHYMCTSVWTLSLACVASRVQSQFQFSVGP